MCSDCRVTRPPPDASFGTLKSSLESQEEKNKCASSRISQCLSYRLTNEVLLWLWCSLSSPKLMGSGVLTTDATSLLSKCCSYGNALLLMVASRGWGCGH